MLRVGYTHSVTGVTEQLCSSSIGFIYLIFTIDGILCISYCCGDFNFFFASAPPSTTLIWILSLTVSSNNLLSSVVQILFSVTLSDLCGNYCTSEQNDIIRLIVKPSIMILMSSKAPILNDPLHMYHPSTVSLAHPCAGGYMWIGTSFHSPSWGSSCLVGFSLILITWSASSLDKLSSTRCWNNPSLGMTGRTGAQHSQILMGNPFQHV